MAIIVSHVIDFRQKILSQLQCITIYGIDIFTLSINTGPILPMSLRKIRILKLRPHL